MKNTFSLICLFIFFMSCDSKPKIIQASQNTYNSGLYNTATMGLLPRAKSSSGIKAKNVIFLIGDGMGLTQVSAAAIKNNNDLFLMKFPIIGIHNCQPSEGLITDSAAGATAFSTGKKTFNGAIGLGADSSAHQTILERCEELGMATGMVATSTIVHATPASFISHRPS